jgi:hypothetical protein
MVRALRPQATEEVAHSIVGAPALARDCSRIAIEGISGETTRAARRPAWSPHFTLTLILKLQLRATALTLTAIAEITAPSP